MEFSEAREWRTFLAHSSASRLRGENGGGAGGKLLQRRCRLVDPEIDARLFTVDELLCMTPERCLSPPPLAPTLAAQVPPVVAQSGNDLAGESRTGEESCVAVGSRAESCSRACGSIDSSLPSIFGSCAVAEAVAVQAVHMRASTEAGLLVGATCAAATSSRAPGTVDVSVDGTCLELDSSAVSPGANLASKCEDMFASPAPMFVRRPPEAYARLEPVESTLTACIRQQANNGDGIAGKSGSALIAQKVAGLSVAQCDENRLVEVRFHLPPYGEGYVVMSVPKGMLVATLRDEVVRRHADKLDRSLAYELRMYDEDEEEPDYDCPPFDEELQVGCLDILEVAVCALGPGSLSSSSSRRRPSPPMSPRRESGGIESASPATATEVCPTCSMPAESAEKTVHDPLPRTLRSTDTSSVMPASICNRRMANKPTLYPLREDTGHLESSPSDILSDVRSSGKGQSVRIATAKRSASTEGGAGNVPDQHVGPIRKSSDSDVDRAPQRVFFHRRTRSSPTHGADWTPVVTVGFETLKQHWAQQVDALESRRKLSGGGTSNGAVDAAATADDVVGVSRLAGKTRRLVIRLADGHAQPDATAGVSAVGTNGTSVTPIGTSKVDAGQQGGLEVAIDAREESTLYEVLEQVASQERGRRYDRVNLALERLDDGISQRLDLNMQVRHLPPDAGVLTMVRKDTPSLPCPAATTPRPGSQWQQDCTIRRPPPASFSFNEHTASIATEYFVTVAARGSRSGPQECSLVVDRERLYHSVPRGTTSVEQRPDLKRGSFMPSILRKLGKHLQPVNNEVNVFIERKICDVRSIACDDHHQRAFLVTYSGADGTTSTGGASGTELVYEAQTPTECAEIVARLKFLQALVASCG